MSSKKSSVSATIRVDGPLMRSLTWLGLVLTLIKASGLALDDWSWWWVTVPLWIVPGGFLAGMTVVTAFLALGMVAAAMIALFKR